VIVQQAIILKKINGDQERAVKDFVRFAEIEGMVSVKDENMMIKSYEHHR
jgi:hypothetical protein